MRERERYDDSPDKYGVSVKELGIDEILQVVNRRKYIIAVTVFLSLVLALIIHFSQTPQYRSSAVMLVTKNQGTGDLVDALLGVDGANDGKASKKDAILLQSLPIAEETVKVLWESPKRNRLEFFGNREYESPIRKLLGSKVQARESSHEGGGLSDEEMRIYALNLVKRIQVNSERDTPILNVSVSSPFPDESQFLTNILCETYRNVDIKRNSEKYLQSNRFVAEMLKEQKDKLNEADSALSNFMKGKEIYEVTANTGPLLTKLVEADSRFNDTMAEVRITRNSSDFIENKLSQSERELSKKIARNVNVQLSSIVDELRTRESEFVKLMKSKGADDPEVVAKKRELAIVKDRYEQLSRSKIAGQIGYEGRNQRYNFDLISEKLQTEHKLNYLEYSANEYHKLKRHYENLLKTLPEKQQEYVRLERDREVVSKTYLFLKEKLDETRILIGSEVGSVSMVGSAFKPFIPESPDIKKNLLLGLVIGIVISAGLVVSIEYYDDRIKDDLFFRTHGYNIWSVVPYINGIDTNDEINPNKIIERIKRRIQKKKARVKIEKKDVPDNSFVSGLDSGYPLMTDKLNSSFAESFRQLRTNLNFYRVDNPVKTMMVSGASVSEGKSTVSANLALAWAISGKKTLLIDCDLRRSSLHKILKANRIPGLTDYLDCNNSIEVENLIQKTFHSNLFLLSAGFVVQNPNELLASQKMRDLLKLLSEKYDKIVIDSPPLFLSDAAQLAHSVDTILLTARLMHSSRYPLMSYAADTFLSSHINGVVLVDSIKNSSYHTYGKVYRNKYYSNYYQK